MIVVADASPLHYLVLIGTLGVLVEAHRSGLLDFEAALNRLRETTFYLSDGVVARARRQLFAAEGES